MPQVRSLNRWCLSVLALVAYCASADVQPGTAMLQPVHELVSFMSTLPAGHHPRVFADAGVCIIENFPPFLFCGKDAGSRWEGGFRAHAKDDDLSDLKVQFAAAHDFSQVGALAYFSLPTTWTGRTHGRTFEEHGAWSFVLTRGPASQWRIVGYGWGVTAYAEQPP